MSGLALRSATLADLDAIIAMESTGFAAHHQESPDVYARRIEAFPEGSLIAGVVRGSPADSAGVRPGDVLLSVNGKPVKDPQVMLDLIAAQFTFPSHFGKNFDALYDCLTDPIHKAGPQPGFILVLDQIPTTTKFDKEAREQFLDCFRDAAEYWAERKIAFRCFYSFL